MLEIVDQLSRPIQLKEPAKRIVSLVPSISEYLFDLGLEEEVVGITKFCIKPDKWFTLKTRIGGTKTVSIEKIKALKPDLIIANKEENTQEEIHMLAELFPTYISNIETLPQAYTCLSDIGILVGKEKEAKRLIAEIENEFIEIKGALQTQTCLYFIWQNPFLVAGKNTFINELLNHLGMINTAINQSSRYPELSVQMIQKLRPEFILLSSEPFPFSKNHLSEFQKLFPNSKVVLVDGEAFSWYGSRLKHCIPYYKSFINDILSKTC